MTTKSEKARAAGQRDRRIRAPLVPIIYPELARRKATSAPLSICGRQTTLGDLLDRAVDRMDARAAEL